MHIGIWRAEMTMSCLCAHHQPLAGFETWWETGVSASQESFTQYVAVVPSAWQCVILITDPYKSSL